MAIESIWTWQDSTKLSEHDTKNAWWEDMVTASSSVLQGGMLSLG